MTWVHVHANGDTVTLIDSVNIEGGKDSMRMDKAEEDEPEKQQWRQRLLHLHRRYEISLLQWKSLSK